MATVVVLATLIAVASLVTSRPVGAAPRAARLTFDRDGHARIPFDIRNSHVWLRGRVNGSDSVWIVLDSGASSSVLDDALVRSLSLRVSGEHHAHGAGGVQTGLSVDDVTIELPGLSVHRRTMDALDLASLGAMQGGRPMQAILGHELFQSCVVRFDYDAGILDVWDAGRAPRDLPGVTVPLTLDRNLPYVEAVLTVPGRRPLRGRFVIDTGSSQALLVAPDVTRRESLGTAFPRTLVSIGRGVGGELRSRIGRAESFALGSLEFLRPTIVMPDSGAHITAAGALGNIGGQLLSRCRVTFDYSHHRVLFEPAKNFERPFETDMSGAALTRAAGEIAVRWVSPETPAAEAGLQAGDIVTEVDGEPAERVDMAALRLRFQQAGRPVRLQVKRGAEKMEMTLTLRRLI